MEMQEGSRLDIEHAWALLAKRRSLAEAPQQRRESIQCILTSMPQLARHLRDRSAAIVGEVRWPAYHCTVPVASAFMSTVVTGATDDDAVRQAVGAAILDMENMVRLNCLTVEMSLTPVLPELLDSGTAGRTSMSLPGERLLLGRRCEFIQTRHPASVQDPRCRADRRRPAWEQPADRGAEPRRVDAGSVTRPGDHGYSSSGSTTRRTAADASSLAHTTRAPRTIGAINQGRLKAR